MEVYLFQDRPLMLASAKLNASTTLALERLTCSSFPLLTQDHTHR